MSNLRCLIDFFSFHNPDMHFEAVPTVSGHDGITLSNTGVPNRALAGDFELVPDCLTDSVPTAGLLDDS
jgi:hypothetical protein